MTEFMGYSYLKIRGTHDGMARADVKVAGEVIYNLEPRYTWDIIIDR